VLIGAAEAGERRFRAPLPTILAFVGRHLGRLLRGRYRKYGNAAVGFGAPLSLREFTKKRHRDPISSLGSELMARVAAVVPVLPVPLVAAELAYARAPMPQAAICERIAERLAALGIRDDAAAATEEGVAHLRLRGLLDETEAGIARRPEAEAVINFYANSIAHLAARRRSKPRARAARS